MDSHQLVSRLFLAHLFILAAAASTIETLDKTGAGTIREAPDGGVDIFKPDGTRAGYGVRRPDGSVDLFRPDGSRLGHFQPGSSGQPSRLIVVPKRR